MRFSERKGITPVSKIIQTEDMNAALRNSLWNILHREFDNDGLLSVKFQNFVGAWQFSYLKVPTDRNPSKGSYAYEMIRNYFFDAEWYEVYDFLEFTLKHYDDKKLNFTINFILERELAGYRFVGNVITDITDEQEVDVLEKALADPDFPSVRKHLQTALEKLSNRENPDYRNSIKESISAVESLAQIITDNPKATLGNALKEIERSGKIHPALKEAFLKLYGYTSDEEGIRHAMFSDEPNLSATDAKFFLLICTSFINYLKSKI